MGNWLEFEFCKQNMFTIIIIIMNFDSTRKDATYNSFFFLVKFSIKKIDLQNNGHVARGKITNAGKYLKSMRLYFYTTSKIKQKKFQYYNNYYTNCSSLNFYRLLNSKSRHSC